MMIINEQEEKDKIKKENEMKNKLKHKGVTISENMALLDIENSFISLGRKMRNTILGWVRTLMNTVLERKMINVSDAQNITSLFSVSSDPMPSISSPFCCYIVSSLSTHSFLHWIIPSRISPLRRSAGILHKSFLFLNYYIFLKNVC
jgi:hypothetical protein